MAPPNRLHQELVSELHYKITDYIKKNNGACKVFPAPFAVFLNADDKTYVEPDISVICDKSKLDDRGCVGAPDWIIEIASPSTKRTGLRCEIIQISIWLVCVNTGLLNPPSREQ